MLDLPAGPSDAELIDGTRSGDMEVFGELVRRFQGRVYTLALRMAGDAETAEAIAHGVFVAAYSDANQLETPLQTCLLRQTLARCDDPEAPSSLPAAEGTLDSEPDTETEEEVKGLQLQAILDKLSPSFRSAVILRDVLELDYPEIGEVMNLPLGTAKSRVHRARLTMAGLLTSQARTDDEEG